MRSFVRLLRKLQPPRQCSFIIVVIGIIIVTVIDIITVIIVIVITINIVIVRSLSDCLESCNHLGSALAI